MEDPPDVQFAIIRCSNCLKAVGYVGQDKCPFCYVTLRPYRGKERDPESQPPKAA